MIRCVARCGFCTPKVAFHGVAKLAVKDEHTMQLQLTQTHSRQTIALDVPRNGTLSDLTKVFGEKVKMTDIQYYCNLAVRLDDQTPINPLVNRYLYAFSKDHPMLTIEGEQFDSGKNDEVIDGFETLEFPVVSKRQIEEYLKRVNRWFKFKTGKGIEDETAGLASEEASQIFVEALIDPQPQERNILAIQDQWLRLYWELERLKNRKRQIDEIVLTRVKRKMALGLALLTANIGFIWSGTYIFYSWDIIEPLAYFVSSFGGIVLAAQFFKLGRPYSNYAYQQYLIDKHSPKIYQQMGFELAELRKAENLVIRYESFLKDYFLRKL